MHKVVVPQPQNDSFAAQLICLYDIFKDVPTKEGLNFELSRLTWVYPLLLLPLSAYINGTESKFSIDLSSQIRSYLDAINFPGGVDSLSLFQQKAQEDKSYIPISVLKKDAGIARERLESLFMKMVYKVLGSVQGTENVIYYPIAELVTNIFEHSKQDQGFVFGQFYPVKNYLDICIADCGRGLRGAYQQEKGLRLSDEDAITEVMQGNSVKPEKERGYGVRTSKRIVCECLKGEFVFVSGAAALLSRGRNEKLVTLPGFDWQGVIIAYRIPKPTEAVDISPYLE